MGSELLHQKNTIAEVVPVDAEVDNSADAMGFWFAAAVLLAVLIASVIVYRTANADWVVASSDAPPPKAALADPIAPPPIFR
jgi:hypothetical protein